MIGSFTHLQLAIIDQRIKSLQVRTRDQGTVVEVDPSRLRATVESDFGSLAVPAVVSGALDVEPGDRVTVELYQSTWVITHVTSRRATTGPLYVESSAGGTGTGATEIMDASGVLRWTAIAGESYALGYRAAAIAGAAGHVINANIRDSTSGADPTNVDAILDGDTVSLSGSTAIRHTVNLHAVLRCPGDLAAGEHRSAVFYVRHPSGSVTANVQLENTAAGRRRLWVARVTGPLAA